MIDIDYLGHDLKLSIESEIGCTYICNKCTANIDVWFNDREAPAIWEKSIVGYIDLISCDEYIIKRIIE